MLRSVWHGIVSTGRQHPFKFGVTIATVKTASADVVTQKYVEDRPTLDYQRLAVFTTFGFAVFGCWQQLLYCSFLPKLFPSVHRFTELPLRQKLLDFQGLQHVIQQICFVNFLYTPFMFFPLFYSFQIAIAESPAVRSASACPPIFGMASTVLERYRRNAWDDLTATWRIWFPGFAVCFSVPLWLRMPVNHGISFMYVMLLSIMRGDDRQYVAA